MATDLTLLRPEMEILHAMELLLEKRISGAPVVNTKGSIVGVLSKKDCLRAALNAAYYQEWGNPVSQYMSIKIEMLDADLDLVTAAERFLASNFRRFPVMQDNRLVGQISRADVLKALIDNWR
jgi:CBS domain-containing protein